MFVYSVYCREIHLVRYFLTYLLLKKITYNSLYVFFNNNNIDFTTILYYTIKQYYFLFKYLFKNQYNFLTKRAYFSYSL